MPVSVLQRLLAAGEYDELDDLVIAEGQFVEVDSNGLGTRQVLLGMTATNLLVAEQHIPDYKQNPDVYYDTEADPYLEGLEVATALPLCVIRLTASHNKYTLTVHVQGYDRYFEMTNTSINGCLEETWGRWLERVDYLLHDPYGYIRDLYDTHGLPYPSYYLHATKDAAMTEAIHKHAAELRAEEKAKAKLNRKGKPSEKDKKERKAKKKKAKAKKKKAKKKNKSLCAK